MTNLDLCDIITVQQGYLNSGSISGRGRKSLARKRETYSSTTICIVSSIITISNANEIGRTLYSGKNDMLSSNDGKQGQ